MKNLFNYIFPYRCLGCERIVHSNAMPLCVTCYHLMPLSHEKLNRENLTALPLLHQPQLEGAASVLYYTHGNIVQKLMHANKYYNQPHIGLFMAKLALPMLKNACVDAIAIVPSHKKTLRTRGYNQVEVFASAIAKEINKPFVNHLLIRIKREKSQTYRNKQQRADSLKDTFVMNKQVKDYKSILFIDDVLTTGSTLNACLSALQKETNLRVYVLVMARV